MVKKNLLTAIFSEPQKAEAAVSNLLEADYHPKKQTKNGKILVSLEVEPQTQDSAKTILEDFNADFITLDSKNEK